MASRLCEIFVSRLPDDFMSGARSQLFCVFTGKLLLHLDQDFPVLNVRLIGPSA